MPSSNNVETIVRPTRVIMSGDLAFFVTTLGKVTSSGSWCSRCDLPRKLWEEADHASESMWTIQHLKNVLAGLLDGTVEDTPTFWRGITQDPLFDSVDLINYILSLLHIKIGVGNQLLKMLLDWIDMKLENIGEEELDIWNEYYEALMEYEIHNGQWMEWKNLNGTQPATLWLKRKTLNNWTDARQENGQNEIKTQSKEMTA
jgi:hypothetical protein